MLLNNTSKLKAIRAALIEGEESGESQPFDVEKFKKDQAQKWLKHNHDSIEAHNKRIETSGPLINPDWVKKKGQ